MRTHMLFPLIAALVVAALAVAGFQTSDKLERKQMREMLVQLGYDVKDIVTDPGKEKYSFVITRDGLDIPIGAEISPSGTYIWYTVNLGDKANLPGDKALALLKHNASIQPCFFYLTSSNRLMMGLPIENRGGVTNAILRQRAESISQNVGKTKGDWQ